MEIVPYDMTKVKHKPQKPTEVAVKLERKERSRKQPKRHHLFTVLSYSYLHQIDSANGEKNGNKDIEERIFM